MISSSTKFCIEAEVCLENKLDLGGNSESSDGQVENSPIRQACDFIAKGQEDLNVLKLNRNSEEIKLETTEIKTDLTDIGKEEPHTCRICLGNDQANNLISPCACTGSQKYVHEECLKTWLLNKKEEDLGNCEVCKNSFNTNFEVMNICLPFKLKTICKAWVPLCISVVLLTSIIYIAYLAISTKTNNAYIIICALILAFGFLICCLLGLIFSFTVCFERKIEPCKIEEN